VEWELFLTPTTTKTPGEKSKSPVLKHHLFSLRVKFILVLAFLICAVMGVVTWLVLDQMRQTLIQQVLDRGESQVRSLALNVEDPLLTQLSQAVSQQGSPENINIDLMQPVRDTMKLESVSSNRVIPSGLSPWQEQLVGFSAQANDAVQKFLWPEGESLTSDVEYAYIVDKNGQVVADNDLQRVNTPNVLPPGVRPMGDGETILTQAYVQNGVPLYDIAALVKERVSGDKLGEVHMGMNQNTITRVVRYVAVAIILTTLVILMIGIIGMAVFITILIKPIRLLVSGVSAIAGGDLDQKINIRRSDELGDLTDAFNNMAKSLREKEVIKGAFSKYVTKSVVDRILQHQDGLKLGGEKKVITIFFSDIRGFTPMSEVLSAEEVVHLLNEYFTAMTSIIFKYEGTLDKFMGDAIMAIYGAPIDMPDHAERAVLAAVEMSEKMKELQAKWRSEGKREVNIGIGINTGEAVVGNIGSMERMEYTAIGDNVNLTQRLESVAEKGQILISSGTYERVKHKVTAVMLDPIKVKGKTEKVIAYSVQGLIQP
jgi:class 3 adenylate cyclase